MELSLLPILLFRYYLILSLRACIYISAFEKGFAKHDNALLVGRPRKGEERKYNLKALGGYDNVEV